MAQLIGLIIGICIVATSVLDVDWLFKIDPTDQPAGLMGDRDGKRMIYGIIGVVIIFVILYGIFVEPTN